MTPLDVNRHSLSNIPDIGKVFGLPQALLQLFVVKCERAKQFSPVC
jgi:hypothetical protein